MWQRAMRSVPLLRNYDDAVAREASIVPLKSGPLKGKKPVGDRRVTNERIEKKADGSIIVFRGWRDSEPSTWVRWYPNGDVFARTTSYSTCLAFIGAVLGIDVNQRNGKRWMHDVWAKTPQGEMIRGSFLVTDDAALLRHKGAAANLGMGSYELMNPTWPEVRRTSRRNANMVRKRYAELRSYVRGVVSVNGGVSFTREQITELWGDASIPPLDPTRNLDNFKVLLELAGYVGNCPKAPVEPMAMFKCAVWLARTQLHSEHPSRWRGPDYGNDPENRTKDIDFMMRGLDTLLFEHHADEVFYHEPSYEGRVV